MSLGDSRGSDSGACLTEVWLSPSWSLCQRQVTGLHSAPVHKVKRRSWGLPEHPLVPLRCEASGRRWGSGRGKHGGRRWGSGRGERGGRRWGSGLGKHGGFAAGALVAGSVVVAAGALVAGSMVVAAGALVAGRVVVAAGALVAGNVVVAAGALVAGNVVVTAGGSGCGERGGRHGRCGFLLLPSRCPPNLCRG